MMQNGPPSDPDEQCASDDSSAQRILSNIHINKAITSKYTKLSQRDSSTWSFNRQSQQFTRRLVA